MAGVPVYHYPKPLLECWWLPMERTGLQVERSATRGVVTRARAKVSSAFAEDKHLILVFSSLLMRRGKNVRLAEQVERMLLASGAKVYGEPISTNLVYRVDVQPDETWLKRLNSAEIAVQFVRDADQGAVQYPSGELTAAGRAIRFWTGPAIEPQSKRSVHFVALDADAADLTRHNPEPILKAVDVALSQNGATRLEVQLETDALTK